MPDSEAAELRKRLDRIGEIFGDIVSHAEKTSIERCPYRDRFDSCTALFSCRNQQSVVGESVEKPQCGHDGVFDYRDAWEAKPGHAENVKQKSVSIRAEAEERRGTGEIEREQL